MTCKLVRLACILVGMAIVAAAHPVAAEPLRIYAAGSLTAAFTDMVHAFPATADLLRREGFSVATLDMAELMKAESGVTCSSLLFDA